MADGEVVRIPPFAYIHVLDNNTNLTKVVEGPLNFFRKNHELITKGPEPMIKIPPMFYCIILNPAVRSESGKPAIDEFGMIKVKFGDKEVRVAEQFPEAFPLYPFEELAGKLTAIPVVQANQGLLLRAVRTFTDVNGEKRHAGDTWLHRGPCTFIPRVEVEVLNLQKPITIQPNTALQLRALRKSQDASGAERKAGEEWLVREAGHYLPTEDQEVVATVKGTVITDKTALHLSAKKTYTDVYGVEHQCGDEWILTLETTDFHIPDVSETVVAVENAYVLSSRQFCYIVNPVDSSGKNQFGKKILRRGEAVFFLKPFEQVEMGIQNVYVLGDQEALLLKAKEGFPDPEQEGVTRVAGEKWMIYGPRDYVPDTNVEVLEKRMSIPLDENEGIYIRDTRTGEVRAEVGHAYMLKPHESFWNMELSPIVEQLYGRQVTGETFQVAKQKDGKWVYEEIKKEFKREKHRVIAFRVPHNSAVQVFNYMAKTSRVIFGPDRVMLQPDEEFTVVKLSGNVPKQENVIQNIALMLGPDFMADQVVVETIDHAKLRLTLSYNWHFDINKSDPEAANAIFKVHDFVGDACKSLASRIRGNVSAFTFEYFHTHSTEIIKNAVFGKRGDAVRKDRRFEANNLVITNVDIQSVEPVDDTTKLSLQKSITRAIEITTESSKSKAEFAAKIQEQHSTGLLQIQKISDDVEAEKAMYSLYELQGKSFQVRKVGEMTAAASSETKAKKIELESQVTAAELEVQSETVQFSTEQELLNAEFEAEYEHQKEMDTLEVGKARELNRIEATKFLKTMDAIGRQTIVSMARAGPEYQSKMLKGLGLKGFMVMSGKNPINLMGVAGGLLGSNP